MIVSWIIGKIPIIYLTYGKKSYIMVKNIQGVKQMKFFKKGTALICAAACAVSAFALTACSGEQGGGKEQNGGKVQGSIVSASEWEAALSLNELQNFKLQIDARMDTTYEGVELSDGTELYTATVTFSEFAIREQKETSTASEWYDNMIDNAIIFYDNGMFTEYERDGKRIIEKGTVGFEGEIIYFDDDWVVKDEKEMTPEDWQKFYQNYKTNNVGYVSAFSQSYAKFTYDQQSFSYKFKAEDGSEGLDILGLTFKSVEIKFENKKAVSISFITYEETDLSEYGEVGISKQTTEYTVAISYGTFDITPPTSFIKDSNDI